MTIHPRRSGRAPRAMRRGAALAAAVLAAVVLAGCATDEAADAPLDDVSDAAAVDSAAETEADTETPGDVPLAEIVAPPAGPLPPEDTEGLAVEPLLAAMYAETGTLLTRGALIERRVRVPRSGPTVYEPRDTTRATTVVTRPHLALYLAFPDEDLDDLDRYLDAVVPLTFAFASAAFERWPDLESFDICLVPASDSDESPEPAIALVDMTIEGYERWVADGPSGADLVRLQELAADRSSGVRLQFSAPMQQLIAERDASGPA